LAETGLPLGSVYVPDPLRGIVYTPIVLIQSQHKPL